MGESVTMTALRVPRRRTATLRSPEPASRARRVECLAGRTLVSVARQRKGLDAGRCQLVFEHLDTAQVLQHTLHRALAEYKLSELQFAVLVALFAIDPAPATPADLADYTAVSRAAITDALVRVEELALILRTRDQADRRVCRVQLTDAGRTTVDRALVEYLKAAGESARLIDAPAQRELLTAYRRLQQGAEHRPAERLSSP
jgi:DNA-binding MarR family transcriptional regulator